MDESPIVGVVESETRRIEPEVMSDASFAPPFLMMSLDSLEGRKDTNVRMAELFTLSLMRSQREDFPSFAALIVGDPGGECRYLPMTAERCDEIAEMLRLAAADLRGDAQD